jgi:hypothetical protein
MEMEAYHVAPALFGLLVFVDVAVDPPPVVVPVVPLFPAQ